MAASATTTSRVGTVLGVAILGSLFNNQLIENGQRLLELEIPQEFHDLIIDQVLTGQSSQAPQKPKPYAGRSSAKLWLQRSMRCIPVSATRWWWPVLSSWYRGYRLGDFPANV